VLVLVLVLWLTSERICWYLWLYCASVLLPVPTKHLPPLALICATQGRPTTAP